MIAFITMNIGLYEVYVQHVSAMMFKNIGTITDIKSIFISPTTCAEKNMIFMLYCNKCLNLMLMLYIHTYKEITFLASKRFARMIIPWNLYAILQYILEHSYI